MATEVNFRADLQKHLFIGDTKTVEFPVYSDHEETTPINITGWSLEWTVRSSDKSSIALITKSTEESPATITITGVFNADKATNTQKVVIDLQAIDSYNLSASPAVSLPPNIYRHALKRTDEGSETTLVYGDLQFMQSTVR